MSDVQETTSYERAVESAAAEAPQGEPTHDNGADYPENYETPAESAEQAEVSYEKKEEDAAKEEKEDVENSSEMYGGSDDDDKPVHEESRLENSVYFPPYVFKIQHFTSESYQFTVFRSNFHLESEKPKQAHDFGSV